MMPPPWSSGPRTGGRPSVARRRSRHAPSISIGTVWSRCAPASMAASTPSARPTSTTPAAGCTPSRSSDAHRELLRRRPPRQPALRAVPPRARRPQLADAARRGDPGVRQRLARRVHGRLHGQRQRRAQAGRRGVSRSSRGAAPADDGQPQLGQRHPRVRRGARGAEVSYLPAARPRPPTGRGRASWPPSTAATGRPAPPVRLPRPVQLLGRPHPLDWSPRPGRAAGTCCSTPPRSCRPTGSTCRACSRTS